MYPILSQDKIREMSRKELLNAFFPKAVNLWPVDVKENEKMTFEVSDYFGRIERTDSGDFFDFIRKLASVSNSQAVNTIKTFFDRKDIKLGYDDEEKNSTAYILGKGTFNGVNYEVRATSTFKYDESNYKFFVV